MEMVKVRVWVEFTYELPADLAERNKVYGETDPSACIQVDLDNDPVMVFDAAEDIHIHNVEGGEN